MSMNRSSNGKITSFDIAYRAGVSQPTVSRALRGDRSISRATREKIEQIARELNYTVDKNASSLRSQRSNTIALLFFEDPTPDDSKINPFFLAMLGSITKAAGARGYDLLISFQRMEDDWHTRYQDSHRADGLILLGYGDYTIYRERLQQLVAQRTKFVRWGAVDEGDLGIAIGSDNHAAGRLAGRHLLALGRKRIVYLGQADARSPEFEARFGGLNAALLEAGVRMESALQRDALNEEFAGYQATMGLLEEGLAFDAIFAGSDLIATGALRALREWGRAVPDDIAVIGCDNIAASAHTRPPLSTITQDTARAGSLLVETLARLLDGRPGGATVLPVELVARESTGMPSG